MAASDVDCNHPDVLSGKWAYGAAVCKSVSLGTAADVLDAHAAEMRAAGWKGGWNAYQDALAKKAARGGGGLPDPVPPAPFPVVQLAAGAVGVGLFVYWWRS